MMGVVGVQVRSLLPFNSLAKVGGFGGGLPILGALHPQGHSAALFVSRSLRNKVVGL